MNYTQVRIIGFLLLIALSLFRLVGCGHDPVQSELIDYINNEVPKFATLETEIIDSYESVSGDNFK